MIIGGFISGPKIFPLRVIKYDYRRTQDPRIMTYPVQITKVYRNVTKLNLLPSKFVVV